MQRWMIDDFGRDRLSMDTIPVPDPGPGEVLVKVTAVALNARDGMMIANGMGSPLQFPFVPGSDMAGVVEAVGAGVDRFSPGDRVISNFMPGWTDGKPGGSARVPSYDALGGHHQGVFAEYLACPAEWLSAAPQSLSDAEASTLPVAGLTAWCALVEHGRLRAGQTVLVQGTGGVAMFGAQIALAHGAKVIVTTSSSEKRSRVMALGIEHVIDRTEGDWVEQVYAMTDDHGADHILEVVGGDNLGKSILAVAVAGRISVIGLLEGLEVTGPTVPLILKAATVQGIVVGHRRSLDDLVRAIDLNSIKPVIDRIYAWGELPKALDHIQAGAFGKVVVEL